MNFPGERKISLGGHSHLAESKAELLQKGREERRRRQQRKDQERAAVRIQVLTCQAVSLLLPHPVYDLFVLFS